MRLPGTKARTPVSDWHVRHGAKMKDFEGWLLPTAFTTPNTEEAALREAVALVDLSSDAKISIRGEAVAATGRTMADEPGLENPRSVIWFGTDSAHLACLLTDDHLLLLSGNTGAAEIRSCLAGSEKASRRIEQDVTSAYASFALLGPRLIPVVQRLTTLDVTAAALPPGRCAETNFAGVHAILIHPPLKRGPLLRICVGWDVGEYVWESILAAGQKHGLMPIGLECWRCLNCS